MKKVFCLLICVLMTVAMLCPVIADTEDNGFVPSISYKPVPDIVTVTDDDGNEAIGVIRDGDGNIVDYIDHSCLTVVPVAHAIDPEHAEKIDAETKDRLLNVYNGLKNGTLKITYGEGVDASTMVVRDLFDVVWSCEEHKAMLGKDGFTVDVTFDIGVMDGVSIVAQTYNAETGEWEETVKTVNNGDGTVTVTFAHFCVVALSMAVASGTPVAPTPAATTIPWLWILIGVAAVAVIVIVIFASRKKKKA